MENNKKNNHRIRTWNLGKLPSAEKKFSLLIAITSQFIIVPSFEINLGILNYYIKVKNIISTKQFWLLLSAIRNFPRSDSIGASLAISQLNGGWPFKKIHVPNKALADFRPSTKVVPAEVI